MSLRKTFSGKARIYNTNTHKQLRIDINLQYSILLRRQYDLSELIISLLISYDFCVSRILCLEGLSVLSTLTVHDRIWYSYVLFNAAWRLDSWNVTVLFNVRLQRSQLLTWVDSKTSPWELVRTSRLLCQSKVGLCRPPAGSTVTKTSTRMTATTSRSVSSFSYLTLFIPC